MSDQTRKTRAVVLLSGGMDSCVCATLAARDYEAAALHISYGQRTEERERRAFQAICDRLSIRNRLELCNPALAAIGGSALTDPSLPVPQAGAEFAGRAANAPAVSSIPITYVPFRNAHFLAAAVSWAEVLDAEKILIGAEPMKPATPVISQWCCWLFKFC